MSAKISSLNPATGKLIKNYDLLSEGEVLKRIDRSQKAYLDWRKITFAQRSKYFLKVADVLEKNIDEYAKLITTEMGKTLTESVAEVKKSALACRHFANNAETYLQSEAIKTDASRSEVRFDSLGTIFLIMPWNFPFWQVFRAAAPAMMAGNAVMLKHASNVPGCALAIEDIFIKAGIPKDTFQTLLINSNMTKILIAHPQIKTISLTGSDRAGSIVASLAGSKIKKTVLELGGSDPFIICQDADLKKAAKVGAGARLIVAGQSCIAAKRFIVNKKIADKFLKYFSEEMKSKKVGDPLDPKTDIGPLASEQIVNTIDNQVKRSIKLGAKVIVGGKRIEGKGYFYPPTVISNLTSKMPVYCEETFGPVAAVIVVEDDEDAVRVANDTKYGLGSAVWTKSRKRAEYFIKNIEAGNVFVNSLVKSDPRLPFGGIKASGFGRELSEQGIKEFVNIKSVYIADL